MKQTKIQTRQNEEEMLKTQFVAREYFNRAEKINYFVIALCIISAVSVILPETIGIVWEIVIPLTIDLLAMVFELWGEWYVKNAASLRAYFDAYVLDIEFKEYSASAIASIRERVNTYCENHDKKCRIQINNTGSDKPPGVKDWYVFPRTYNDKEAQLECQKQNSWWNDKLCKIRVGIITILLIAGVLTVYFFAPRLATNYAILRIIFSSAIIIKIIQMLIANINYFVISLKINAISGNLDNGHNKKNLINLQNLINERRSISVLEINFFHKLNARKWTRRYQRSHCS